MTKQYNGPVNRFTGPTIVMLRECHARYDARSRPIPVKKTPVEQRTGKLLMAYASRGVEIPGGETGRVYPNGATFNSSAGFQIYLEVYPRRSTEEDRRHYLNGSVWILRMAPTPHTPLAMMEQASVYARGGTHFSDGSHMTIMAASQPSTLMYYLRGSLPLIGVDPRDVDLTISRIQQLMTAGQQRLTEVQRRLSQR